MRQSCCARTGWSKRWSRMTGERPAPTGTMAMTPDALRTSRILVTGASGFLGSHLCDALLACGAEVHAVSRREPEASDRRLRWLCSALDGEAQIETVLRAVRPDVVFHLAGHV